MKHKPYFFQMAVKAVEDTPDNGVVVIEGFASTPDVDRYNDIVEPKAFSEALDLYMKNPVLLYQHDPNRPVGVVTSARVTEKGLQVRAEIKEEDSKEKVLDGRMRAFSFGWIPLESELKHQDGSPFNAEVDSIWDPSLVRVVKNLDLVEISIVTTPANGNALFTVAKSVKSYFTDIVTKSFMLKKETEQGVKPDTSVAASEENTNKNEGAGDTSVASPPAAKAADEAKEGTDAGEEGVEDADQDAEEEEAAEGAETNEGTEESKSSEAAGNADENAATDGAEGQKAEEANADAKPTDGSSDTEAKAIVVTKEVAKILPELVGAGHLVEAKDAGQAVAFPKEAVALLRKLSDAYIAEAKRAEGLDTEVKSLTDKLQKTPEKKALANVEHTQLGESDTGEKTVSKKKTEPSEWFKKTFNLK